MVRDKLGVDETDKKIISILQKNPTISQSELSKVIGISQPAVGSRIRKLKEKGILSFCVGMNFKKVSLFLAKVDITTRSIPELMEIFKECPYFINGLVTSGKNNLCLFFACNDIVKLEAIVDEHLRMNPEVIDVEFNIVLTPIKDLVLPVKVDWDRDIPCGKKCEKNLIKKSSL